MGFGENFEQKKETKQEELKDAEIGFKKEFDTYKTSILYQNKGQADQLPEEQVNNISTFCDEYLDDQDSFVIRARADGFGISQEGSLQRKNKAQELASQLKTKGFEIKPDLSTGNAAQAWIRAMTLINQLPIDTLDIIKNKIQFDVKTVEDKDEKGTYRFASFDIKRGNTIIPDIQKGGYEDPNEIDNPSDEIIDESNQPFEELNIPETDRIQFSSWEALKKPLSVPVLIKVGKEYYIKHSFYKWEDGKLFTSSYGRKKTSKENFQKRISDKGLKANSISLDLSDSFSKYEKTLTELPKLTKRLEYLNTVTEGNSKFALDKLYQNYDQRKGGEKYLARAKENDVQNKQYLLANN